MADGATATVDSLLGRNIGHFRVDSLLGHGGMGAVYRAFDLSLDRPVALKTVLLDNPQTRALFIREARAQAKLRHANVVPVHYIGDHEGLTYLVMELVEGESLASKVEREGAVGEARALEIIDAVAAALESAHAQGLVHRDVKPSNVLVEPSGRVLLADFGLAKVVGVTPGDDATSIPIAGGALHTQTTTKGAIGTPAYIAPELTSGARKVDHRADIYSLGVTLYELVTGKRPFTGPTNTRLAAAHERAPVIPPRLIVPSLSKSCETMILRMLAKAPEDRYQNYAELRRDLAEARAMRLPAAAFTRTAALTLDLLPLLIVDFAARAAAGIGTAVWTRPVVWGLAALLFAGFESRAGRTWGKKLVGLRTIDELGKPPRFAAAVLRSLVKLWGPLASAWAQVFIPHSNADIRIGFNGGAVSNSQATAIVVFVIWAAWMVITPLIAARKSRAALHDVVAKTRVIVDLEAT